MIRKILFMALSAPKTIVFNLKYFGFKDAVKMPVFVSYNTKLIKLRGTVTIASELKTGMVRIGFSDVAIFDKKFSRPIFKNDGNICFDGRADLGHGVKIAVGPNGKLRFGNKFLLTAESQIVCKKAITFGDDCLLSWDILIMDCDFHDIKDNNGMVTNPDKEITIGSHVWIGARSMVKKGISIADGCIIASQSVVVKNINTPRQVWGGNPAVMLKEDVNWSK
jgi:acetyltransferase-like isoleucine patch superfamily enzyme